MFIRPHRIGRHIYTEALESYRDPAGRHRHRCIARWRAERSLAQEIGRTLHAIEQATRSVAYSQGVIDGTVRPHHPRHRKHVRQWVKDSQRGLEAATARLAVLMAARLGRVPAEEVEIKQAAQAEAIRWGALTGSLDALLQPIEPPPLDDRAAIAERVRRLAVQNPDALRAEVADIAAGLDAFTSPAAPP